MDCPKDNLDRTSLKRKQESDKDLAILIKKPKLEWAARFEDEKEKGIKGGLVNHDSATFEGLECADKSELGSLGRRAKEQLRRKSDVGPMFERHSDAAQKL